MTGDFCMEEAVDAVNETCVDDTGDIASGLCANEEIDQTVRCAGRCAEGVVDSATEDAKRRRREEKVEAVVCIRSGSCALQQRPQDNMRNDIVCKWT